MRRILPRFAIFQSPGLSRRKKARVKSSSSQAHFGSGPSASNRNGLPADGAGGVSFR